MKARRIRSRKTGKRGWKFRYTNPLTHARSWKRIWFQDPRTAEAGFREFMEGLEARALNLPGKDGWKVSWSDAVGRFLEEAPISTDARRAILKRVLTDNPLDIQVLADLTDVGRLTARTRKLREQHGESFSRMYVQQPAKQLSAWAGAVGLLPHDPLAAWKLLPRQSQPQPRRAFLPQEVEAVFSAADELDSLFNRRFSTTIIYRSLLLTGNRPGAILAAKAGDLDTQRQRIVLPAGNGRKRNGMAFLPPPFIQDLEHYLASRGRLPANAPLFVAPNGGAVEHMNLTHAFTRAMTLGAVKLHWPQDDALAVEADPVSVADAIYRGRVRGFDGAPTQSAAKLARRARHVQVTEAMAARISAQVSRFLDRRDMYCLRKTHVSWARRLVNSDSVKLQVGHAPRDIEEKHYLDLVDARESALAVWQVLTGERSLSGERRESRELPLALAAGAENLHVVDSVGDSQQEFRTQERRGIRAAASQVVSATTTCIGGPDGTRTRNLWIDNPAL